MKHQLTTMLQQVDVRLIPMLAALYLIAHLDRSNIGNTKASCISSLQARTIKIDIPQDRRHRRRPRYQRHPMEHRALSVLRPIHPARSPQQHPPQAVRTTIPIHGYARDHLGSHHDHARRSNQLRRLVGSPHPAWSLRSRFLSWSSVLV